MKSVDTPESYQKYSLLAGSILIFLVSILHIYIALVGDDLYITFGAGKEMAQLDKSGSPIPMTESLVLAFLFLVCSIYGLSAATARPSLPFVREITWITGIVFTLRGLVIFYDIYYQISGQEPRHPLYILFSLYAMITGLLYLTGIYKNKHHDKA